MNNHDKLIAGGVPPAILLGAKFMKTAILIDSEKILSFCDNKNIDSSLFKMLDTSSITSLSQKYPNLYDAMVSDEGVDLILGLLSLKGVVSGNTDLGFGKSIEARQRHARRNNKHNKNFVKRS